MTWAIIAYLEDEDAAAKVADIVSDSHDAKIPLLMTVVNAGEVWLSSLGKHLLLMLMQVLSNYAILGFSLLTPTGV